MTLEQTISAVEEIIEKNRVEIPEDLMGTISSKAHARVHGFGYFNGRKVVSNTATLKVVVYRLSKSTEHYFINFDRNGSAEKIVVNVDNIEQFCDEIADVQDVAIV